MVLPNPEQAKGWLTTILPVLERGGPVAALILGLCALAMIYGLYTELARVHDVSHALFQKLERCYETHLEVVARCAVPPRENH